MPTPNGWLTPTLISKLEALQLSIKWVRAGSKVGGRFAVNRRGSSVEFADHAPYYAGDDIRAIDWNLYARLDRLFVKTYREEIELSVEVIVDATLSMSLPRTEKFTRALQLAICLGYVGLAGRHHVRVSLIREGDLTASPSFHRRSDLLRLRQWTEKASINGKIACTEWMRKTVAALHVHGGQAILLTDGMVRPADFFQALHVLAQRNVEIKVIQVLTPQELHPSTLATAGTLIDAETGQTHELAYAPAELERAMAEHNELLARFCKRQGILFVQHHLDEPLERFLTKTLPMRGVLE